MPKPYKHAILCVHAHQPVGNFEHVFREGFDRSYLPFFQVLERHPKVKFVAHFSGSLIDWIEKEEPSFFRLLKKMRDRGQLEIMGGAYYEPIYGVIPPRDLAGQLALMRGKLEKIFGAAPEGVWLAERVWDPQLIRPLSRAGVGYTVLDDFHFKKTKVGAPTGYFRARDGRESVDVFASAQALRYLMPFRRPEDTIDFLRKAGHDGEAVVFADDCEKFGMWPGTHEWVFGQGWLDKFFTLLEKSEDIRTETFGEYRRRFRSKRDVKLPHGSYGEMMDWCGGRFYNFFDKYPESRYMRDRMWHVSESIDRLSWHNGSAGDLVKAQQALYKAQCNCTYWHGVFGGLYLHHLRSAVFENLIKADRLVRAREASKGAPPAVRRQKFASGERWRLEQGKLVSFFNPAYGAALEELDYLPASVNLMCNLQRREEPYHQVLAGKKAGHGALLAIHTILGTKESDLEKHLIYDPVRRLSFLEHVFENEISQETFARAGYRECGDFATGAFKVKAEAARLSFERRGSAGIGRRRFDLRIAKTFVARGDDAVECRYRIENLSREAVSFVWATEFNFSIGEPEAGKGLTENKVTRREFHDAWRNLVIGLESSAPATLVTAPVETVSESESGLEKTYQELAILLQRPLALAPRAAHEAVVVLSVR